MPALSFSERKFVDKINDMEVFTTFRPHTRDPPRLKVGDLVTCFFKQRAKRICKNCLNFSPTDSLCMQDERALGENTCDEFNKIICKAGAVAVEKFEITYDWVRLVDRDNLSWPVGPMEFIRIAELDKFDSTEEFLDFFNKHYNLPMIFDRYKLKKIQDDL